MIKSVVLTSSESDYSTPSYQRAGFKCNTHYNGEDCLDEVDFINLMILKIALNITL